MFTFLVGRRRLFNQHNSELGYIVEKDFLYFLGDKDLSDLVLKTILEEFNFKYVDVVQPGDKALAVCQKPLKELSQTPSRLLRGFHQ